MRGKNAISLAVLLAAALLSAGGAFAEEAAGTKPSGAREPARYRISVITMGQGPELFARFGHIGFLVEDGIEKTARVYNFGTFDFANPALRFKYLKGYLIYWVSVQSMPYTMMAYRSMDRTVDQRVLNISAGAAARLAEKLATNARPENREYEYRHYLDNCCTRIRDLADEAGGGAIAAGRKGAMTGRTYRDWTRWSLKGLIASDIAVNFILGPTVDQPVDRWAEEFLPAILAEDLDKAVLPGGTPLVGGKTSLYTRRGPPLDKVREPWDIPAATVFFTLLALGLAAPIALGTRWPGLGRRLAGFGLGIWAFLGGGGGAVLTFLWGWTTHYDTHRNENLLCFLPTHLLLFIPAAVLFFRGRLGERFGALVARYLAACAAVVALSLLLKLRHAPQDNYGFMAFGFLMNVACWYALRRTAVTSAAKTSESQ